MPLPIGGGGGIGGVPPKDMGLGPFAVGGGGGNEAGIGGGALGGFPRGAPDGLPCVGGSGGDGPWGGGGKGLGGTPGATMPLAAGAYVLEEQGILLELVDPKLGSSYSSEEALRMLNLALLCTNPSPTLRPSMSSVVSMIEGKIAVQAPIIKCSETNPDAMFKAFGKLSQDSQTQFSTISQDSPMQREISMTGPWIDSSISVYSKDETRDHSSLSKLLQDLYDVNIE
ncbi:probable LRR receptor-like serine/threonine-protein kinase At1g53440 [Corylus avellana]|uniref:probable LRR receptor-like serine/threonine-protein kinase At1g53440 n=1 Tax=Corylus avellana TaxID=13451 RepID=UPI00286B2454|nr:probable LRR receptor-like serine/threonine-protein kinase At1g53440 [Corylus avellana]